MIYEFRVKSYDLRVLRQELGARRGSYEFRVRSCDLRVLRHKVGVFELRVQS